MDKTESDGLEAAFFASTRFLTNLAAFVRGRGRTKNDGALLAFEVTDKPATLTSLSPEVLACLQRLPRHDEQPQQGSADRRADRGTAIFGEDGTIDWSRVPISSSLEEDGEEALEGGARLAASCHAMLLRSAESNTAAADGGQPQCARAFPCVFERIVQGSDEEAYLALCVCLAVLEEALYGIYREGSGGCDTDSNTGAGDEGGQVAGDCLCGGGGGGGTVVARAMILRDLIATPQVKAALPEQVVAVLRLLLLPLGFNIRNLVVSWLHGSFLSLGNSRDPGLAPQAIQYTSR